MGNKPKRKLPVVLGVAFIVVFVAIMALSTFGNAQFKVEVCEGFGGQSVCRNGAAATKAEAQRIATVAACTDLTHGMTELLQCQNSTPVRVTWK